MNTIQTTMLASIGALALSAAVHLPPGGPDNLGAWTTAILAPELAPAATGARHATIVMALRETDGLDHHADLDIIIDSLLQDTLEDMDIDALIDRALAGAMSYKSSQPSPSDC